MRTTYMHLDSFYCRPGYCTGHHFSEHGDGAGIQSGVWDSRFGYSRTYHYVMDDGRHVLVFMHQSYRASCCTPVSSSSWQPTTAGMTNRGTGCGADMYSLGSRFKYNYDSRNQGLHLPYRRTSRRRVTRVKL